MNRRTVRFPFLISAAHVLNLIVCMFYGYGFFDIMNMYICELHK